MTVDDASVQPASPLGGLLARHPLVFYFLIAYAGSWLVWMPLVLSEDGVGLLPFSSPLLAIVLLSIGTFLGPTLSAFIMTGITEGSAGVRRLLGRIVLWRVGLRWYLFALIGIPLVMVLGTFVLPGALASFEPIDPLFALTSYLPFFVFILLLGPLGEEPGWRGFALPRLQLLYGPLVGSIILWPLWVFWHLPLLLVHQVFALLSSGFSCSFSGTLTARTTLGACHAPPKVTALVAQASPLLVADPPAPSS
jgi:membrane protease YdiL (CAAX protease family)